MEAQSLTIHEKAKLDLLHLKNFNIEFYCPLPFVLYCGLWNTHLYANDEI